MFQLAQEQYSDRLAPGRQIECFELAIQRSLESLLRDDEPHRYAKLARYVRGWGDANDLGFAGVVNGMAYGRFYLDRQLHRAGLAEQVEEGGGSVTAAHVLGPDVFE